MHSSFYSRPGAERSHPSCHPALSPSMCFSQVCAGDLPDGSLVRATPALGSHASPFTLSEQYKGIQKGQNLSLNLAIVLRWSFGTDSSQTGTIFLIYRDRTIIDEVGSLVLAQVAREAVFFFFFSNFYHPSDQISVKPLLSSNCNSVDTVWF